MAERRQREKVFVNPIQMRFDDRTWEKISKLSNSLGMSKVKFVRSGVDVLIKYLENNSEVGNAVADKLKAELIIKENQND